MSPTFVFDADEGALRFPALTAVGVDHVVTTRRVGVSAPPYERGNLGLGVPDDRAAVLANRAQAVGRIGLPLDALTLGQQTHHDTVVIVGPHDRGRGARGDGFPATDGLITATPGVALMTLLADCSALLLVAPDARVIGLAHVGWRGTVARLAEKLAQIMVVTFGADPARLTGALAPG
ncbi:MAG: polyphenol oxidase family protein, partial [Dehalococcoidia bacterium]|nr:polyphenol oxidase family protein [Dehalococcoidia bacterium]